MSVDGTEAAQPGPDKPVLDETWTPVEQLPAADDSDYSEEETTYVTLDFGPDLPPEMLAQLDSFQLTSLNTAEPWARVGPAMLRGRHERMLGSDLLFVQEPRDPDMSKAPLLELMANTHSRVRFEKVNLVPKKGGVVEKQNATTFLLASGRGSRGGRVSAGGGVRRRSTVEHRGEGEEEPPNSSKRGKARLRTEGAPSTGRGSRDGGRKASPRTELIQAAEHSNQMSLADCEPAKQTQLLQEANIESTKEAPPGLFADTTMAELPDVEEF